MLLIEMMRPYIPARFSPTSEPQGIINLYPRRRIQAVLEVIAPQVHEGDHATTAEILHTGSQESLTVELIRLFIYLETNAMAEQFRKSTGCNANLSNSANVMGFLRGTGFLTKANINLLATSTEFTSQVLLERLLAHSIVDENSLDVLGWLTPGYFDVNYTMQTCEPPWDGIVGRSFRRILHDYRNRSRTLLQACSLLGHIHAVRFLLDSGAEPYAIGNGLGYSPLECAASLAHHDRANIIADLLLSKETRRPSEFQIVALEGALQVAIAESNTGLIVRLLSERKRFGRETIYPEWFTVAAKYADLDTIRLLADSSPRRDGGRVKLHKSILLSALEPRNGHVDLDRPLNMVDYLLQLGADTAVLRCRHGCGLNSFSNYIYLLNKTQGSFESREQCALNLAKDWRKHGCSFKLETPEHASEAYNDHSLTVLRIAIYMGYALLVEYLLDWGIDTYHEHDDAESQASECDNSEHIVSEERPGSDNLSPLLTSLQYQRIGIAKMLLSRLPNLRLFGGEQKLAMAAGDDTELMVLLLQAGSADVEGWENFLEQAVLRRNAECTSMLLSMNYDFYTIVCPEILLRATNLTQNQDIIFQQISVCNYSSRALFDAVLLSHGSKVYYEIVDRLLANRSNTPNDHFEVLAVAFAAVQMDLHLMEVLVENLRQGPWNAHFPPIHGNSNLVTDFSRWVPAQCEAPDHVAHILSFAAALELSIYPKYSKVLETLLSFNISAKGMNLRYGGKLTVETWKHLIGVGADPNLGLLQAVQDNKLAHVEVLCQAGVLLDKMHIGDRGSRTAVQAAVERGSPEMLQMLLGYGADIEQPAGYDSGATCLQLAAGAGNVGLVRFLLEKGVNVNAKRALMFGRTAVEAAAGRGRLDVLKLLLLQQEHLFRTAAERHQFIRATKFADIEDYKLIVRILKEHIGWNENDQETFEALKTNNGRLVHIVDGMTQELLDSESRDERFWGNMAFLSEQLGFDNIYEIEGIEQWIGRPDEEHHDDPTTDETDLSSEGEVYIQPGDTVAASQERNDRDDKGGSTGHTGNRVELRPDTDQRTALMQLCGGIDDAVLDSGSFHGSLMDEEPAIEPHVLSLNPGWGGSATALAPRAIRYEAPAWLDMQDNGRGIQDVTYNLPLQDNTWEALAHRHATQNVNQEPGMVIGEVLDEEQHIKTAGDGAVDPNDVEDMGEAGHTHWHVQHFNWGKFWDDESFAFHSGNLAYLDKIRRGSG